MTAEHDTDQRYWGAKTLLESWLDWHTWRRVGLFPRDFAALVTLLDAAKCFPDAAAAHSVLVTSGRLPRQLAAAEVRFVAGFLELAEPGLADALREQANVLSDPALSVALLEFIAAAEALDRWHAVPYATMTPGDCGPINELLDGSELTIDRHVHGTSATRCPPSWRRAWSSKLTPFDTVPGRNLKGSHHDRDDRSRGTARHDRRGTRRRDDHRDADG